MSNRSLITAGAVGAALAALCCATPLLAVVLGGLGLTAWLAKADDIVIPALLLGVAVLGLGLYRRLAVAACCNDTAKDKGPT